MKEKDKKRRFFATPWPFVSAAILFALVTPRYLDLYSSGHWSIKQSAFVIETASEKLIDEIYPNISDSNLRNEIEKIYKRMKDTSSELKKTGGKVMISGAYFHITGLISLLFTAFAFVCKPRWPGFISLPFSLYVLKYFNIVM